MDISLKKLEALVDRNSIPYVSGRDAFRGQPTPSRDFSLVKLRKFVLDSDELGWESEIYERINTHSSTKIKENLSQFIQPTVDSEVRADQDVDLERNDFRFGFIDALVDFMVDSNIRYSANTGYDFPNISFDKLDIFSTKKPNSRTLKKDVAKILLSEQGLIGYIKGFQIDYPEMPKEQNSLTEMKDDLTFRAGYELGFMVRIAQEFGYTMNQHQVPNKTTHLYFLEGLGKIDLGLASEFKLRNRKDDSLIFIKSLEQESIKDIEPSNNISTYKTIREEIETDEYHNCLIQLRDIEEIETYEYPNCLINLRDDDEELEKMKSYKKLKNPVPREPDLNTTTIFSSDFRKPQEKAYDLGRKIKQFKLGPYLNLQMSERL